MPGSAAASVLPASRRCLQGVERHSHLLYRDLRLPIAQKRLNILRTSYLGGQGSLQL